MEKRFFSLLESGVEQFGQQVLLNFFKKHWATLVIHILLVWHGIVALIKEVPSYLDKMNEVVNHYPVLFILLLFITVWVIAETTVWFSARLEKKMRVTDQK